MIILIGGVGYAGKTFTAQKLLEKYKYPYLSIDHLKMGLYLADIGCGFTPHDSVEHISEIMWPILKGIITTNIENKQNLIIEGGYLLPQKVKELESKYPEDIIPFYLGFSNSYINKNFHSKILENRCAIEERGYNNSSTLEEYILENIKQKNNCKEHDTKYFEIDGNYDDEMDKVYAWIERGIK